MASSPSSPGALAAAGATGIVLARPRRLDPGGGGCLLSADRRRGRRGSLARAGIRGPLLAQLFDRSRPPGARLVIRDSQRDPEFLGVLRHAPIRLEFADDLLERRPVGGPAEVDRPAARRSPHQILGRQDLGRLGTRLGPSTSPSTATSTTPGFLGNLGGSPGVPGRKLLRGGLRGGTFGR